MTRGINMDDYDRALDDYLNIGIDNMDDDEVEFLKSGGRSKTPRRWRIERIMGTHLKITEGQVLSAIKEDDRNKISRLKEAICDIDFDVLYPYENVGTDMELFCTISMEATHLLKIDIMKALNCTPQIEERIIKVEAGLLYLTVPKSWISDLV